MRGLVRIAGALAGLLTLSACLVTPGRFESSLDIRADRRFAFTYSGEILASDLSPEALTGGGDGSEDGSEADEGAAAEPTLLPVAAQAEEDFGAPDARGDDAEMRAIAAALSREQGFRSVRYLGERKFAIDYAVSGRLDHAFLFPFNIDAQIMLPFIAVELRGPDRVRVKAPGFATGFDKSQGPAGLGGAGDKAAKALDGRFTLTTDAQIISQNQEDGAQDVAEGKRIVWSVTPLTSDAPMATLRLAP